MKFNKRISVHHIGARSGSRAFPVLNKFEKDVINVLYDADPDCLAQVRERNRRLQSELHVLPYCLADTCKSTSINITYDPYTSSLYEANPDYGSYCSFNKDHDYIISEVTRVMERRGIQTVSLDHLFRAANAPTPPPDFLSIDTQGSEYEILQGAKETLRASVLALITEAEFHPIYEGQRLFGDLARLLSDQGFHFVRFLSMHEASPFRAPIGLRGNGFHMATDALFLRRIDNIDSSEDRLARYVMLRKLAFIAIVFSQFEFGLECLRRSEDLAGQASVVGELQEGLEQLSYYKFLTDLERQIEKMPQVFPRTFASKYTFETSTARFESPTQSSKTETVHGVKGLVKRIPILLPLLSKLKRMLAKAVFLMVRIRERLETKGYSNVEMVLINYGLESQAKLLKKHRVVQSRFAVRGE